MNLFTTKTDAGNYDIKQAATSLGLDPGEISDGFIHSIHYIIREWLCLQLL